MTAEMWKTLAPLVGLPARRGGLRRRSALGVREHDEGVRNDAGGPNSKPNFLYFYHPDYSGSVEFVTDMRGDPYQFFLNTPFGENLENQMAYQYKGFSSRFRFNAKEWDEETGNYYYGARYYDPKVSVWLSVDPLAGDFPSWTPYHYVHNNPINLIDPTGMRAETYEIDRDGTTCLVDNQKYYRNNETGEVGGTNCDNCTEVDRVVGKDNNGNDKSTYVSKGFMGSKKSKEVSYSDNMGNSKDATLDYYHAEDKNEAQDFLEFTYDVTNVEFDYNHTSKYNGMFNNHVVSTVGDNGASLGKSLIGKLENLEYSLHTHPSGNSRPSGLNSTHRYGDVKAAGGYPGAVHQIYSGSGYTTYDGFGNYHKSKRR